jgi:hypothetical protein
MNHQIDICLVCIDRILCLTRSDILGVFVVSFCPANAAVGSNPHLADSQHRGGAPGGGYGAAAAAAAGSLAAGRVAVAYQDDPLRVVVERLAGPGVRRLVVVDRATRRVMGVVALSDVAAYLFL